MLSNFFAIFVLLTAYTYYIHTHVGQVLSVWKVVFGHHLASHGCLITVNFTKYHVVQTRALVESIATAVLTPEKLNTITEKGKEILLTCR